MKIHTIELRHVRQIKEAILDVSAPLTVIGGPNGVGKTTVQEAVRAAMFLAEKKLRDSLISRFDPDEAPQVVLHLSRGDAAGLVLSRIVTDDRGEWRAGATTVKQKGKALKEVQKVLPISADAAAFLLWGRQEDMTAILDRFPSDGHSLLTAAAIKGSGPDPKQIIHALEKEFDEARKGERGGQLVGSLTQARNKLAALTHEVEEARRAAEAFAGCRQRWQQVKDERDQLKNQAGQLSEDLTALGRLEKLLDTALRDMDVLRGLQESQADWESLEEELGRAQKDLQEMEQDRAHLQIQHRVSRDLELTKQIDMLARKIKDIQKLEHTHNELENAVKAKKRPAAADVKKCRELSDKQKSAADRMEASGVRYELSADARTRSVRVVEDGEPEKQITLEPGQSHQGIVGRVTIDVDGVRLVAAGKEDISAHKRAVEDAGRELFALFKKFAVDCQEAFQALSEEGENLRQQLSATENDLKALRGRASLDNLKTDLQLLQQNRMENNATPAEREACSGRILPSVMELSNRLSRKEGEIERAREELTALEQKRPTDADKVLLRTNLGNLRRKARASAESFKDADPAGREPTRAVLDDIKLNLERKRKEQSDLSSALTAAERSVAGLEAQLSQANPSRPIELIDKELEEAAQVLRREKMLQDARLLLKKRIEQKMSALAAHVPVELGDKITEHLSALSAGAFREVRLHDELALAHVGQEGEQPWQPVDLSYGERHQAALAVKIAVARALAESTGPVFIMLDDSLVAFDPARRQAAEKWLLELVADEKLQIILFTCHTDWAADWKQRAPDAVSYVELPKVAHYYRTPSSLRLANEQEAGPRNSLPAAGKSLQNPQTARIM